MLGLRSRGLHRRIRVGRPPHGKICDSLTPPGHIDLVHQTTDSPWATVIISAARGRGSLTESGGAGTCTGRQHRSEMRGRVYAPMSVRHWSRTHVTEMIEETATEVFVIAFPPAAVSVRAQSHRVLYRTVGSVSGKMAQPVISGSDLHCRRHAWTPPQPGQLDSRQGRLIPA